MRLANSANGWFLRTSLAMGIAACACTGVVSSPNGSEASSSPVPSVGQPRGDDVSPSPSPTGASGSTGSPSNPSPDPSTPTPAPPGTDPGRVTLHRLNRAEYNNTVRDLFGTTASPADVFPVDDRGNGFDNMSDVLSLSPTLLSLYQAAASDLVEQAFANATAKSKLVACDLKAADGASCARTSLQTFVPKAWRRPTTAAEVDELMSLVTLATSKGDSVETGLKLALQATVLSPHFIFRVELDAAPTDVTPHPLSAYELASRLSYFLWSTTPDAELLAAAASGTLTDAATLAGQAKRLVTSDKAQAFVDNFAGQWLETRKTREVQPDPGAFPSFDAKLRTAMIDESNAFFKDVMLGNVSGKDLLQADFIYANDRLATHYGLPAVGSATVKRVSVTGNDQRGGILGEGSFLTVTSHGTRTSPVLRGKWVLNQLLCTEIPPPPPDADVTAFETQMTAATLRERLVQHRANPTCATCHSLMDPIGFGLENYDAIGAYRTKDGGANIDASGQMPDGSAFSGMRQLAKLISDNPSYARCFVSKVYTYALGRGPQATANHMDSSVLETLTDHYLKGGMNFPNLVSELVSSGTFMNRRGEPEQQ